MLVVLPNDQNTSYIHIFRDLKDATNPDPQAKKALAAHIREACINVGFFYGSSFLLAVLYPVSSSPVINHGLPESTIERALGAAKRFFALPLSAKEEASNQIQVTCLLFRVE